MAIVNRKEFGVMACSLMILAPIMVVITLVFSRSA